MMKKDDDAIKTTELPRPKWNDAATYADPTEWSYRQWAWEFLRRNKAYEAATKKKLLLPKEKAAIAQTFGRSTFKRYSEGYGKDDAGHHWLPEAIVKKALWYEEGSTGSTVTALLPGEVALVFDLSQTLKGGTTAISSLLGHARKVLLSELEQYKETFPKGKGPKMFKVRRSDLFHLLRLHDAIVHARAEEDEVVRILYRSLFVEKNNPSAFEILDAKEKMVLDLERAKKMVDIRYLTLVPLDSIQERKSTKQSKSAIQRI